MKNNMMTVATITTAHGKVQAIPATNWSPIKKQLMEAAAARENMIITYTRMERVA